ncbi:hypothetical protein [Entomospira culicis]|uniref:Uncharacterized protein n=1 Tax=Entomospira culicis TaxID=2719989 RepID=A0A968GJ80_9SPIO|nr:hypothetical protein [Entomospira culicis]NIZ19420.1 hypothetical protein [Entomospira culicis]NIZ69675.1 hypothetical protein [Entomospira culicis]WDI36785.1 hypothetical protein PVA46_05525 [Entomospira culicis]WDI38414.1 hypothetical protein PVA47_05535 [Entomospira culicis]
MDKILLYTASYIEERIKKIQFNPFSPEQNSLLKVVSAESTEHISHILFYSSLKKSFKTLIKSIDAMDEATLYGSLHMLHAKLYPIEQLREQESLLLVNNQCQPTTLNTNIKKYHYILSQLIHDIYHETKEESIIAKYRSQAQGAEALDKLTDKLYRDDQLDLMMVERLAKKIPLYAKHSHIPVEKDLEPHLISLYMHHYVDTKDEIYLLVGTEKGTFPIQNEAWYNLKKIQATQEKNLWQGVESQKDD